ncbi:hypothetical protein CRV15_32365 (plasmid) [Streptomyces clavuligerus]|uniref:Uncharacterized protein n=1 Tax=Streptomyces clavuligerus TaxID=1901 RepID=B5GMU5_STRCL|nr:hypothetical protein D1794_31670 [Streptomyces clavuligerus]EDY47641.1 hypothetical protein SSCG_00669 [Streptomyces clavuligerus]EFG04365.1 Hypothetical protein SCLAV_p0879 [Streptomyces clavuligerus]QCS10257.1 hypothetical protein CRV15_32365 [Streptomyces clavuligerus]QPJ97697.1 hypothetical protein GE265_32100 [Streptomyces clavuligerus]
MRAVDSSSGTASRVVTAVTTDQREGVGLTEWVVPPPGPGAGRLPRLRRPDARRPVVGELFVG